MVSRYKVHNMACGDGKEEWEKYVEKVGWSKNVKDLECHTKEFGLNHIATHLFNIHLLNAYCVPNNAKLFYVSKHGSNKIAGISQEGDSRGKVENDLEAMRVCEKQLLSEHRPRELGFRQKEEFGSLPTKVNQNSL